MKPLAVDLACGLGGWTDGLLAEGWNVIGFDIERHKYGSHQYPAQLVLQDILTLDGRQFRGHVSLIVASPPCQEFSYMAMPWTRAKRIAQALHARKLCGDGPPFPDGYTGSRTVSELTALFDACVRIGREAECPIVIENVRGAQPWVGRSRWHYGSYHLFGDVPALMPITFKGTKVGGLDWSKYGEPGYKALGFNTTADQHTRELAADDSVKVGGSGDDWFTHHNRDEFVERATKNSGGLWFNVAHNTESGRGQNPDGRKTVGHVNQRDGYDHTRHLTNQSESDGVKQHESGRHWFADPDSISGSTSSKSNARKAASARIAMIPLPLARWIARCYFPKSERAI